jgi:hypothetical protein
MAILGVLLVIGIAVTARCGGVAYTPWEPGAAISPVRAVTLRYLRGVAIALVAGFWTGALLTGPAIRLIMRLLAVTAGDDAQGRITEAREQSAGSASAAPSASGSSAVCSPGR